MNFKQLFLKTMILIMVIFCSTTEVYGAEHSNELSIERQIFNAVNEERALYGLEPLIWNFGFQEGAELRASEVMQLWSDIRPDGTSFKTVDSSIEAENLALLDKSYGLYAPDIIEAWMQCKPLQENILDSSLSFGYVTISQDSEKVYIIMEFGK